MCQCEDSVVDLVESTGDYKRKASRIFLIRRKNNIFFKRSRSCLITIPKGRSSQSPVTWMRQIFLSGIYYMKTFPTFHRSLLDHFIMRIILFRLIWFYGISSIKGFLTLNIFYTFKQFHFKQFSFALARSLNVKTVLF